MRGGGPGEIRDDTYETASEVRLIICRQPTITNPRAADKFLKLLCWSSAGDVAGARSRELKLERETGVFIPRTTDRIEFIYRFANDSLNDHAPGLPVRGPGGGP